MEPEACKLGLPRLHIRKASSRLILPTLIGLQLFACFVDLTLGQESGNNLRSQTSTTSVASELVAAREGSDLDLSCPIEVPSEDMIISWSCNNEPANIRSSRVHVTETGKLRIRSAKMGDSCDYRCEAAQGFGSVSVVIKVLIVDQKLIDSLKPQIKTELSGVSQILKGSPMQSTGLEEPREASNRRRQEIPVVGQAAYQQPELEVQLEPNSLQVDKGRTISLECRVKHPPQMMEPKIIWLKEFIGQTPASLSEAHEQNLALIDGVYYHSLNWPRTLTHKRHSGTLHSALLVRQPSYLHSGRYICFAGYPPYTVGRNLSLVAPDEQRQIGQQQHQKQQQANLDRNSSQELVSQAPQVGSQGSLQSDSNFTKNSTVDFASRPPTADSNSNQAVSSTSTTVASSQAAHQKQVARGNTLRYRMALSRVKVNDPEGFKKYQLMLEASGSASKLANSDSSLSAQGDSNLPLFGDSLTAILLSLLLFTLISLYLIRHCFLQAAKRKQTERSCQMGTNKSIENNQPARIQLSDNQTGPGLNLTLGKRTDSSGPSQQQSCDFLSDKQLAFNLNNCQGQQQQSPVATNPKELASFGALIGRGSSIRQETNLNRHQAWLRFEQLQQTELNQRQHLRMLSECCPPQDNTQDNHIYSDIISGQNEPIREVGETSECNSLEQDNYKLPKPLITKEHTISINN